ncbi:MAG TPA: alpha/beta fold hydrolase [Gammaproteobacteria bacterium]
MSFFRFSVVFAFCLMVSGCVSFDVTEDFWFNPGFAVLGSDELREAERVLPGNPRLEVVRFAAADGTPLYGLHMQVDDARPTVLYFGGDVFRIARHGIDVLRDFARMNVNVLLVDYRGYGGSGGTPTLSALHADALAAFEYLRDEIRADRIVLHGFSMGSFVASGLIDEVTPSALVLEATATNVPDWADFQVPWYAEPFVNFEIADTLLEQDNRVRLQRYRGPLLLIAGAGDRITPPAMARELYEIAGTRDAEKRVLVSRVAHHGDAMQDSAIIEGYRAFLERLAGPPPVAAQ